MERTSGPDAPGRYSPRWRHHPIPWSRGKPLAWDVTVPDTDARVGGQLSQTGRRCSHSCSKQQDDQVQPASKDTYIVPGGHRNSGTWHDQAEENRKANDDHHWWRQRDHLYLFQQLSVAFQRGNAVSFQSTFTTSYSTLQPGRLTYNIACFFQRLSPWKLSTKGKIIIVIVSALAPYTPESNKNIKWLDGNIISAANTWAASLVRYSAGIVNWRKDEVEGMDMKSRKLVTISKFHLSIRLLLQICYLTMDKMLVTQIQYLLTNCQSFVPLVVVIL